MDRLKKPFAAALCAALILSFAVALPAAASSDRRADLPPPPIDGAIKAPLAPAPIALPAWLPPLPARLVAPPLSRKFATVSASMSSGLTIVTPASGTKWCLKYLVIRSSGAGVVAIKDGATTVLNVYCPADTNVTRDGTFFGDAGLGAGGMTSSAADATLSATLSGATGTIDVAYELR